MDRKLVEHFKSNMSKKLAEYVEHEWFVDVPTNDGGGGGGFYAGVPPQLGTAKEKIKSGWQRIKERLKKIRIPGLKRPIDFPVNTPIPRERSIVPIPRGRF